MDFASDNGFLDFAGTAGVNDEVRRKEEAEIREIVDTIKRTNEKIKLAAQTSSELSKSEKHALNEARELLQAANDMRNGVTVDCGIAKTLVHNVITSSLTGSEISKDARKKGVKGISEATTERLAAHTKSKNERKQRMTELSTSGKQKTAECRKHRKTKSDNKKEIEKKNQTADLEQKASARKTKTEEAKTTKANLVKDKEKLQNQVKQKIADLNEAKNKVDKQTAELNNANATLATMVAELTYEEKALFKKKDVLREEIYHVGDALTLLDRDFVTVNDQFTAARTTIFERSKLEEKAKGIRKARNTLAVKKKNLEMELLDGEKKMRGLDRKHKEIKTLKDTVAALISKTDKLDEAHPSSKLDQVKKELEAAQSALKDLRRGPEVVAQLEVDHKKKCDEKRQATKVVAEQVETASAKNLKMAEGLQVPDPSVKKANEALKEVQAQLDNKENRIGRLGKKAFDNRRHQLHIRKYKVLKAARKLHDQESSHMAKIAKLKKK